MPDNMVNEKDLPAIADALLKGYEIRMWMNADGVKIVAEKRKIEVLKSPRKNRAER